MEQIIRIGMDTSKHFFQLHGVNAAEQPVLRRKLRRQEVVRFFAKLPPTVVGYFLLLIFGKNGLLGGFLARAGFAVVFTLQGAVIAAAVVSFPLMYRAARGAFEQLDQDLVNAGRTLGLSESTIFRRIMLPNCWPGIAAGAILAFARALGEYGATSMLAGNIPGKTQTMSLAIASAVAGNNRDRATLWVVIIMGISLVTMVLMNLLTGRQSSGKREAKA